MRLNTIGHKNVPGMKTIDPRVVTRDGDAPGYDAHDGMSPLWKRGWKKRCYAVGISLA